MTASQVSRGSRLFLGLLSTDAVAYFYRASSGTDQHATFAIDALPYVELLNAALVSASVTVAVPLYSRSLCGQLIPVPCSVVASCTFCICFDVLSLRELARKVSPMRSGLDYSLFLLLFTPRVDVKDRSHTHQLQILITTTFPQNTSR